MAFSCDRSTRRLSVAAAAAVPGSRAHVDPPSVDLKMPLLVVDTNTVRSVEYAGETATWVA